MIYRTMRTQKSKQPKPFKYFLIATPLAIALWIAGAHAYRTSWWIFANFFGDVSDLQNIFAPQVALFSAVTSLVIVATFISQAKQFYTQNFESDFMNMLHIHITTRSEIAYKLKRYSVSTNAKSEHGTSKGPEAFIDYFNLYQVICSKFNPNLPTGKDDYLNEELLREIEDYQGMLAENEQQTSEQTLFEIAHKTFDDITERRLWHYYKHLYRTIKFTHENAPKESRSEYLGIIRANLSTHEHAMVYYNAPMVKDYEADGTSKPKFQLLIENTAMLHNFPKEILFDNNAAGEYALSAYENNL